MSAPRRILLISGSLRAGSTNAAVLDAAAALMPTGFEADMYDGMARLPHFNPDHDREGEAVQQDVAALRGRVGTAAALLVCTPEYAGALPGALKNLLEWTVGDASTYLKPIAWINASGRAAPSAAADAHESLRKVLGYVGAEIVEDACARIPIARTDLAGDGRIRDAAILARIERSVALLAARAAERDREAQAEA